MEELQIVNGLEYSSYSSLTGQEITGERRALLFQGRNAREQCVALWGRKKGEKKE